MEEFLKQNNLEHLAESLINQGADLDFLLGANDHELLYLVPGILDKAKLRIALEHLKEDKENTSDVNVSLPFRAAPLMNQPLQEEDKENTSDVNVSLPFRVSPLLNQPLQEEDKENTSDVNTSLPFRAPPLPNKPLQEQNHTLPSSLITDKTSDDLYESAFELDPQDLIITAAEFSSIFIGGSLKSALESTTTGRQILQKRALSSEDRKIITNLLVEIEIRKLKNVTDPIRKDVWENWGREIVTLFPGEDPAVYYSPFKLVDGIAIRASGLILNRLITARRKLTTPENKRSRSRSSSSSSSRSTTDAKKRKTQSISQRIRPLPDRYNKESKDLQNESAPNIEDCLTWLKSSSSPKETVHEKWRLTHKQRIMEINNVGCYVDYLNNYPALKSSWGYELLASDFDEIHPETDQQFVEKFAIVKSRLLCMLDEKIQRTAKDDQSAKNVLHLASEGEEQANIAAFLAIPSLLKHMHTISVKGGKPWNPSKTEVLNGFLKLLPSTSDINIYRQEREEQLTQKKVPVVPFIAAIGNNWSNISQYDLVISKEIRYTFETLCAAITNTFKILWVLDLPYPKDCIPIWMVVQRAMFGMVSKYDIVGTPVLDLLVSLKNK